MSNRVKFRWNSVKLNTVVNIQRGFAFKSSDYVNDGHFILRVINIKGGGSIDKENAVYLDIKKTRFYEAYQLEESDILLVMVGATTGKLGLVKSSVLPALLNQNTWALRPKDKSLDKTFFYFKASEIVNNFLSSSQGSARDFLKQSDFGGIRFDLPSLNEQKVISAILQTIDQTIEKTEALIEKYQQIKAGLMHDLFTRGITVDGKLRPPREQAPELYQETSIGWIPKDWGVVALGEISDIASGVTLNSKLSLDQTIAVPYLRVANVQDGYLDLNEVKEILVSQRTLSNLLLQSGDVLMNEGGDFDKLGRGTVWEGEIETCIHQNHVFRVRTYKEVLRSYYLAFWSESNYGKKYFILSSKQSTNLASINSTQLNAYPIGLPCNEEQHRIEKKINAVNSKITSLRKEKQKLDSQKYGLMHDLLTGKVKVTTNPQVMDAINA